MPSSIIKPFEKIGKKLEKQARVIGSSLEDRTKATIKDPSPLNPEGLLSGGQLDVIKTELEPKDKPVPPPPVIEPPTRMPTSSDQAAATKKSIREQLRRRGRASTILTSPPDALGG